MNSFQTITVCIFFITIGALVAIFARKIVNWLYERTMNFLPGKAGRQRKEYTDQEYQESWPWKAWWAFGVWTYRVVGILIAVFFTVVLILLISNPD